MPFTSCHRLVSAFQANFGLTLTENRYRIELFYFCSKKRILEKGESIRCHPMKTVHHLN